MCNEETAVERAWVEVVCASLAFAWENAVCVCVFAILFMWRPSAKQEAIRPSLRGRGVYS